MDDDTTQAAWFQSEQEIQRMRAEALEFYEAMAAWCRECRKHGDKAYWNNEIAHWKHQIKRIEHGNRS